MHGAGDDGAVKGRNHRGNTGDDTGEQDHGDAVAHAKLVALLAQPHQEAGAGHEGDHDHQGGPDTTIHQDTVVAHEEVVAQGLEHGDGHSGVAGDGLQLALALLAAVTAHTLQGRDGHGQQLDDDGAVDIGLDTHGEHRRHREGAAAHHVVQAQNGGAHALQIGAEHIRVHIGHRDGVADPVDQQNHQGENDLLPQLGDAPSLANGLDHVTSPPLSHQPPRWLPWRTWRKRKPLR